MPENLYELLTNRIPLFAVPGTEDSDVVEYETVDQRFFRGMEEAYVKQLKETNERLRIQLAHVELIGPWEQKRLPESMN